MSEQPVHERGDGGRVLSLPSLSRRAWFAVALRAGALLGAALAGRRAYQIFYADPLGFNDALPLYALAFGLLIIAAWNRALLGAAGWPARAARYARAHPVELALLLAILGMGAFIRLWKYGTLPPSDFLCCEEALNAGAARGVWDGARPLNYALVRYSTAFGLWAFGETTNGLRLPFVIIGIATIIPFYLLLRELMRTQAALFAAALFSALHSLGDTSVHSQPGVLASILFTLALVRGVKTANTLWWLTAGFLGAALSYEYEPFKMVPLVAAVFGFSALFYTLLWPPSSAWSDVAHRARELARRGWWPGLIFALTLAIALTPMFAKRHHGEHIYVASLNRQQAGRTATGLARYLSPRWEDQLKWVGQIYTPMVEPEYVRSSSIDARGVIDKATSVLLWCGLLAAAATFWRSWRLYFLGWLVGGSVALALLVQNFGPWKAVAFLPPGLVLVGFLVDDLWGRCSRLPRFFGVALSFGLVLAVGFTFSANALILHRNAADPGVLAAYAVPDSETYASCRYLRTRPEGSYSFLAQWSMGGYGFALPRENRDKERFAWQNHYFVCRGLQGILAPSGQELWPLLPPSDRPVAVALVGGPANVTLWRQALERAMPGLAATFTLSGPGHAFEVIGYQLSSQDVAARQGLWATYSDGTGRHREEVVDPEGVLPAALPAGKSVLLTGLVRVPAEGSARSLTASGADVDVRVDGQATYSFVAGQETVTPLLLSEGWHFVEVTARQPAGTQDLRFAWRLEDGSVTPIAKQDFFALADTRGWLHTRSFVSQTDRIITLTRFDFEPHVAWEEPARLAVVQRPPVEEWQTQDDIWVATWRVPVDTTYHFAVDSPGSDVELRLDGVALPAQVDPSPSGSGSQFTYQVATSRGDHRLELRFRLTGGLMLGGRLTVTDAEGGKTEPLDLSPAALGGP